ncbi:MAG TPA: aldo/keto reductase [Terriglobales bacterium]|nr:aldo/keto reductase [Terriglobales bacterium]
MCSFDDHNSPVPPHNTDGSGITRRRFLATTAIAAAILPLESTLALAESDQSTKAGDMQFRTLGRTGEKVSVIGVGGAHIGGEKVSDAEAIRIMRTAIDSGVNFMDNCWDYHDGRSEMLMGRALQGGYRQKVFLMTKIDGRDAKTAAKQINESLQRLKTDHIDLMQIHEVIRSNDPQRCFEPGGAMEAIIAAKKAGKIRYVGFTGHKSPDLHLRMIDVARKNKFHFDTMQMPINIFDAHYDSFEKRVLPVAEKEGIAVLGMKPMGGKFLLETKTVTPVECLQYALSQTVSVVITGIDSMNILKQDLRVAREFQPMGKDAISALLQKTAKVASTGKHEKYKTSTHFDGTHRHPEWLGPGGEKGVSPAA